MSTLTYTQATCQLPEPPRWRPETERRGFWRRLFDGMVAAQQRRAEREIARLSERPRRPADDDMEREIMQRLAGRTALRLSQRRQEALWPAEVRPAAIYSADLIAIRPRTDRHR